MMPSLVQILYFWTILAVTAVTAVKGVEGIQAILGTHVIMCHGSIYDGNDNKIKNFKLLQYLSPKFSDRHRKIAVPANTYIGNNFISFKFGLPHDDCPEKQFNCHDVLIYNEKYILVGVGTISRRKLFPCEVLSEEEAVRKLTSVPE